MGIFISNTLCSRPKVTTWKGNIVLRHYAQLQRHLFNCFLQKCIISLDILIIWGLLVPDRSGLFRILVPPLQHGTLSLAADWLLKKLPLAFQFSWSMDVVKFDWHLFIWSIYPFLLLIRLKSTHVKIWWNITNCVWLQMRQIPIDLLSFYVVNGNKFTAVMAENGSVKRQLKCQWLFNCCLLYFTLVFVQRGHYGLRV